MRYIIDSDDFNIEEEYEELCNLFDYDISSTPNLLSFLLSDGYFNDTASLSTEDTASETINEIHDFPVIIASFQAMYGINEQAFWELSVPNYRRLLLGLQLSKCALSRVIENRTLKNEKDDSAKVKGQKHLTRETFKINTSAKTRDRLLLNQAEGIKKKDKMKAILNSSKGE